MQNSAAAEFWILQFGIKEVMGSTTIQFRAAATADFWFFIFDIKETLVVTI